MSYLFVFRAYPDIDHMAPVAWRLLEDGEEVHAVISPGYDPEGDHRLDLLRRYPRFALHRTSRLRNSLPRAIWRVARGRVRVVAVEWGYGLREGYERPASLAGVVAVLRSLIGSLRRWRDPYQTRTNFIVAARLLGRRVVCLPHGLSIKLDSVTATDDLDREFDWSDRNRFDAYVLATEQHRRWFLEEAKGDPEVIRAWGSLRWDPRWVELNRRLAPRYTWSDGEGKVKVVFMLPKWRNRIDAPAVVDFVKRVHRLDFVSLALKGHPRANLSSADPLRADAEIDWSRIEDVTAVDSVSLIAAADVIVDVGSSIGIEAVMQGTVLMNPTYLHEVTTFFDTIPDSSVVVDDVDEAIAYLREHAAGRPHEVPAAAREELLRRAVYASQPEPFDVLDRYATNLRALAVNGHATATAPASR